MRKMFFFDRIVFLNIKRKRSKKKFPECNSREYYLPND